MPTKKASKTGTPTRSDSADLRATPRRAELLSLGAIVVREIRDSKGHVVALETPEGGRVDSEEGHARIAIDPRARRALDESEAGSTPEQGAYWRAEILKAGIVAAIGTSEAFGFRHLGGSKNTLSEIGDHVSRAIRGDILLSVLDSTGWNMQHAAQILRMAGGTPNVLRAIRELGLTQHLEAARKNGLIRGRRPRIDVRKPPPAE